MCFYINKFYDVVSLQQDNFGQWYGDVITPNGTINVHTIDNNNFFDAIPNPDFGLNSIVVAPLVAIRKITNGVCEPLNVNILGKTISMPCGNTIFWDREDVQFFKVFWNLVSGGIIAYGIGISTYKLVHDLRYPDKDRIDVMKL